MKQFLLGKKKLIFNILLVIVLLGIFTILMLKNIQINNNNMKLLEKFSDYNILDANGNVNLSELESKNFEINEELNELFTDEKVNLNKFKVKVKELKSKNSESNLLIDKLAAESNELSELKKELSIEYDTLDKKYQQILRDKVKEELEKNGTVLINDVPKINQYPNYPTGCESVALTILLRYYGIDVSADDVISILKKGDAPYYENEIMYGGNPEIEFIGNPYSYNSYGVYNNPIADVANHYKEGVNVTTGKSFDEILGLVANNRPVVVWTSTNLALPYISSSWIYKPTGEKISWKSNEHAVVVIGYTNSNVIISDPIGGTIKYQSRDTFESRYNYYGKRAVFY